MTTWNTRNISLSASTSSNLHIFYKTFSMVLNLKYTLTNICTPTTAGIILFFFQLGLIFGPKFSFIELINSFFLTYLRINLLGKLHFTPPKFKPNCNFASKVKKVAMDSNQVSKLCNVANSFKKYP